MPPLNKLLKIIQNNEWNATSVILFRVIFSSTAEAADSDDKEEYSEAEGSRYDWDDDDDDDILVIQPWPHHPLSDL